MGQFLPADHSKGDERTIGGYMAVHARPAAFEGSDGLSYSVEIEADPTEGAAGAFGAYFVFVRWSAGEPVVTGHIETGYLAYALTADAARAAVGAMSLDEARRALDGEIASRGGAPR